MICRGVGIEIHDSCCFLRIGAGPCVGTALLRCGSCGAPNYCSRAHQMAHWREHKGECSRMAEQMMRAYTVHDFPFSFTEETVQGVEGGVLTLCSFLEDRDLHLQGLWKAECGCDGSKQSSEPGLDSADRIGGNTCEDELAVLRRRYAQATDIIDK
ncbi:hypothetical protein R1flu_016782 [Riccia fluitans]|uniref:MYND-type domain-containing protein n=1 Tax=Riccia fluitans TaxID=41844 RepID=A0ABD1YMU7_9MARC